MEVKIISEKKNELFSRREIVLEVKAEVVPSKIEAKNLIKDKFSCDEELIRIRKIEGSFGAKVFTITLDIYDSKEEFDRVVKKTKQEVEAKKKAEEEKLKAEAEAKKAEEEAKVAAEKPVEEEKPAEAEEKTE